MTSLLHHPARALVCALVFVIVATAGGCQRYERRAQSVDAMARAWVARAATDPRVVTAARRRGAAFDVRDGISVDEGVLIAQVLHPQVRIAQAQAAAADAGRTASGRWPDPQLSGSVRRGAGAVPQGWLLEWTLSFQIPLSDRFSANRARAQALAAVGAHQARLIAWQQELKVRRAWLVWSAAVRREALYRQHVRAFRPLLQGARALATAGELNLARIGLVELAFVDAERSVIIAANRARMARRQVLRCVGLRPDAPATLLPVWPPLRAAATNIDAARPGATGTPRQGRGPAALAAHLKRTHPALLTALARYEAAEQTLRRAIARQLPTLSVGPSLERDGGGLALGLGVGLPISIFTGSFQAVAQAKAARRVAGERLIWTLERLLADASDARLRVRQGERQAEVVRDQMLPAAAKLLRRLTQLARAGEIDLLLLHTALKRSRAARLAYIDATVEVGLARLALRAVERAPAPPKATALANTTAGSKEGAR